jgi:hypothetical protein
LAGQGSGEGAVQKVGPQLGGHSHPDQQLAGERGHLGRPAVQRTNIDDHEVEAASEMGHDLRKERLRTGLPDSHDRAPGQDVEADGGLQVPGYQIITDRPQGGLVG